jgi:peptide deformylase
MLDIVTYGSDILARKAAPVAQFGPELEAFAAHMFEALKIGNGLGLAAPQVGRSIRLFVTDVEGDKPRVFVNPEIVLTSQELVAIEEGCLSLPGLYQRVERPESVRMQAYTAKGRPFTVEASDMLARVLLHEYDHLDGVLFIDRLNAAKRERALAQYQRLLRK